MKSKNILEICKEFDFDEQVLGVILQINDFLEKKEKTNFIELLYGCLKSCEKANRMKNFSEREKIIYHIGVFSSIMTEGSKIKRRNK